MTKRDLEPFHVDPVIRHYILYLLYIFNFTHTLSLDSV